MGGQQYVRATRTNLEGRRERLPGCKDMRCSPIKYHLGLFPDQYSVMPTPHFPRFYGQTAAKTCAPSCNKQRDDLKYELPCCGAL